MHSSSWASKPDHKDALLLFWLQLTSPWFLSSSSWASYFFSPKSQNWTALSRSSWDWTRDICFNEGKPTHRTYIIFNAIYRCTHVSKYIGTYMFLLFALFAFSSPLIDGDGFFPYNYFSLRSFFLCWSDLLQKLLLDSGFLPVPANHLSQFHRAGSILAFTQPIWKHIHLTLCLYLSSTFPFLTAACPNDHALLNSFPDKTSEQIHHSQDSTFTNSLYLLVNIHLRLQVTWNKTEESIHMCTEMLRIRLYAKSRNSSFIAQGSPDHEIKWYHSFRLLCRFSSLGVW